MPVVFGWPERPRAPLPSYTNAMTQRHRFELLLLAAVLWVCAVAADHQHLAYVVFVAAVSGIVAAVLSWLPEQP